MTATTTSIWFSAKPAPAGPSASRTAVLVHPLPPDGPVTFVASWLLHEVAETRADLDSSVIHEAVQRAVTLWPDEP